MEVMYMTKIKDSNLDEYIKGMEDYTNSIKHKSKEESIQALIRIGVLLPNGKQKKQICTGENYGG